jgi:hypothetical protein
MVAFVLAACGGQANTSQTPATPGAAGSVPPAASGSATGAVEITVTVADGKVHPAPSVHKVARGRVVRIVVTSDRADELHVHGYDKEVELSAGVPATIEFTANEVGRFEVETHESGLQLFQLQVS